MQPFRLPMGYELLSNSCGGLGKESFNQCWQGEVVTQAQSEQHFCGVRREERAWRPPPWHYSFPREGSAAGVPKLQASSGRCNFFPVCVY